MEGRERERERVVVNGCEVTRMQAEVTYVLDRVEMWIIERLTIYFSLSLSLSCVLGDRGNGAAAAQQGAAGKPASAAKPAVAAGDDSNQRDSTTSA